MKDGNRRIYIVIGILLGVIVVLGGAFIWMNGRLHALESQADFMKKKMDKAVLQVKNTKSDSPAQTEESEDVESEYVDVDKEEPTETPTPTPEGTDAADEFNDLEPQIEALLGNIQQQSGGEWAIYVEDLKTGGSMSIGSGRMRAASLIKLYIMGAVYERYDKLSSANKNLDSLLRKMITVSDNDAANELVQILGAGDAGMGRMVVNSFCNQYNFSDTEMGRMLLEQNPSGENYTSVEDCGKFLYNVYNEEFDHSKDMLELLKAQERTSKIPAGISDDDVVVANKTGELDDVQNDAAIVLADTPYVICVMSQGVSGEEGPVHSIAGLSEAVYLYTNKAE